MERLLCTKKYFSLRNQLEVCTKMYRFGFVTLTVNVLTHGHHCLCPTWERKGRFYLRTIVSILHALSRPRKRINPTLSPSTVWFELHICFAVIEEDSSRAFKSMKTPRLVGIQLWQPAQPQGTELHNSCFKKRRQIHKRLQVSLLIKDNNWHF